MRQTQVPPIPLCLVPLPPQNGKHKRRQTQAPPIPLCLVPLPRMVSTKGDKPKHVLYLCA